MPRRRPRFPGCVGISPIWKAASPMRVGWHGMCPWRLLARRMNAWSAARARLATEMNERSGRRRRFSVSGVRLDAGACRLRSPLLIQPSAADCRLLRSTTSAPMRVATAVQLPVSCWRLPRDWRKSMALLPSCGSARRICAVRQDGSMRRDWQRSGLTPPASWR